MTSAKPARINARLTAEAARKVAYLERRTGQSTTEVILASIAQYYEAVTNDESTPASKLANAGFVGCAEGPRDLSNSYKGEFTRSLDRKS